jgi:hypothetical protein
MSNATTPKIRLSPAASGRDSHREEQKKLEAETYDTDGIGISWWPSYAAIFMRHPVLCT